MTTTIPPQERESEFENIEHRAAQHMSEEHLAELDAEAEAAGDLSNEFVESPPAVLRLSLAVGTTTMAAAIMAGGIFTGTSPRIYAAIAGIAGIALAAVVSRLRSAILLSALVAVGIFAVGLLFIVPSGADRIPDVAAIVRDATRTARLNRPPTQFLLGWRVVVGWLMAMVGFAAAWVALVLRRPSLGLIIPLPATAIAAISVPRNAQLPSGIVSLLLFAVGLGLLSSVQSFDTGETRPSVGFELRRAMRALPLLIALTVGLVFLAKANILFPRPLIDPAQEAQKPKTVPLSEVEDRVLFSVNSQVTGPWRMGTLDVYDGKDWRLPAFSQNRLRNVPKSGIVDNDLRPGERATFTVAGLSGAVLPSLPNTIGIIAKGPRLAYDSRNANIRLSSGTIEPDLTYTVTAPALPSVNELKAVRNPVPAAVREFLEIPSPPPAVEDLLREARAKGDDSWSQVDYLRTFVLDNITATGAGTPVGITPDRVQQILAETKEASPFEIVAVQAMLARWDGVPARIGYGFDGGEQTGPNTLEVRPKHGATFLEVYFPGFKWLPVVGTPKNAKPTIGSNPTQSDPNIVPSDDISVQVFLPTVIAPRDPRTANVIRAGFGVVGALLLLVLGYYLWPALAKASTRSRRRARALERGASARIANSYAEWRDTATDFGYSHSSDTPLMFIERFAEDPEHTELAWLVTRSLWGDLSAESLEDQAVAAETLSKALKRRLADAHPATVRFVAALSRLSTRHPYSTDRFVLNTGSTPRKEREREVAATA